MATTNGTALHAPPSPLDAASVIGKRKRSTSPEKAVKEISNDSPAPQADDTEQFEKDLSVLLKIIETADSTKTILSKPIPSTNNAQRDSKRVRLSEGDEVDTVGGRLKEGQYSSVDKVIEDLQAVLEQESAFPNGKVENGEEAGNANNKSHHSTNYLSLKQILDRFASERLLRARKIKSEEAGDSGMAKIPDADSTSGRFMLTLFGNTDRGPRQLFSSLQILPEDGSAETSLSTSQPKYPKIDPSYLPNGITATRVVPTNPQEPTPTPKVVPTFGQVFRPHHSLKPLEPPKPSRMTTRNASVTWTRSVIDAEFAKAAPMEKGDYKFSPLPTGLWLQYAGPKTGTELLAYNEHLSREKGPTLNDKSHAIQPTANDVEASKEKALFQSAYSSFAPVYDDSEAIIPEKIKSQLWWRRSGSIRFRNLLNSNLPPADVPESFGPDKDVPVPADDDFAEAVASFVAGENELEKTDEERSQEDKDLDEILTEISDYIKTLASYQEIRHSSQLGLKTLNGETGSFSSPSQPESEVYTMLKNQLTVMIAMLPPYAVAKLDGDQLQALEIDTKLYIGQDDYQGTMEVDEYTYAKQKAASANAAASRPTPPTQPRTASFNATSTPLTGFNQRAYAGGVRPPNSATPYNRPAYAGATPSQNYATGGRPMPQGVPRYGGAQQPGQPYANTPNVQQFQRLPTGYGGTYMQHQQTPNAAGSPFMQRPSQPGYQQRAQQRAQDTAVRTGSPGKPMDMLAHPPYAASGMPPQQPRYFQQQPPNAQASPNLPTASPLPPNASPMDRTRYQAQMYGQRPPSGTPQPPNGQYLDRSMTPAGGQQNGIAPPSTPVQGQ